MKVSCLPVGTVSKSLESLWETLADSWHTCCSAVGDTNDNKTAVGPDDVLKMGCPCLGEHTKLDVVIEESYEFKVTQNNQFISSELEL